MKPGAIIKRKEAGYKLFIKDDGYDYAGLWNSFRSGRLKDYVTIRQIGKREVHIVEAWGRKFILKIDREVSRHFEVRLWRAIQGPFFSRQMKAVHRAVSNGCTVTPEIYFVAEKEGGLLCRESYSIQEFLEGHVLEQEPDLEPFYPALVRAIDELHKFDLVLSDLHAQNVMVTKDGLKIIDLSWKGTTWAGKGKDIVILKQLYGIEMPVKDFSRRLAAAYIRIKHRIRDFLHD